MTSEKRLNIMIFSLAANIILLIIFGKVIGLRLIYAILISTGISIFILCKIHVIIDFLIKRKQ